MTSWGEIYRQHLRKGEDHGSAAYAADQWQKREDQRVSMDKAREQERAILKERIFMADHSDLGDTTRHVRTCNWWIGAPGTEGVAYEREMKGELRYRDCTCSLRWREMVRTEREMHNAWRKRAEEAEAALTTSKQTV